MSVDVSVEFFVGVGAADVGMALRSDVSAMDFADEGTSVDWAVLETGPLEDSGACDGRGISEEAVCADLGASDFTASDFGGSLLSLLFFGGSVGISFGRPGSGANGGCLPTFGTPAPLGSLAESMPFKILKTVDRV